MPQIFLLCAHDEHVTYVRIQNLMNILVCKVARFRKFYKALSNVLLPPNQSAGIGNFN